MTTDYRVELDTFEGPMDLLLYLIRRAEVDIQDIPIAAITDQYLGHLERIERVDIDLAGEFLVTAATLMEIKSRMIAPPGERGGGADGVEPQAGEDAPDPRAELVQQLLDYKKYRDAGEALDSRRRDWHRRSPNAPAGIDDERVREAMDGLGELEMDDLGLSDLFEAFQTIVSTVNFDRLGEHEVVADDTPIELHAEDILDRLRRGGGTGEPAGMTLRAMLTGRERSEMVGLFLALLTLVRDQKVGVIGGGDGGAGEVRLVAGESETGVGDEFVA